MVFVLLFQSGLLGVNRRVEKWLEICWKMVEKWLASKNGDSFGFGRNHKNFHKFSARPFRSERDRKLVCQTQRDSPRDY